MRKWRSGGLNKLPHCYMPLEDAISLKEANGKHYNWQALPDPQPRWKNTQARSIIVHFLHLESEVISGCSSPSSHFPSLGIQMKNEASCHLWVVTPNWEMLIPCRELPTVLLLKLRPLWLLGDRSLSSVSRRAEIQASQQQPQHFQHQQGHEHHTPHLPWKRPGGAPGFTTFHKICTQHLAGECLLLSLWILEVIL